MNNTLNSGSQVYLQREVPPVPPERPVHSPEINPGIPEIPGIPPEVVPQPEKPDPSPQEPPVIIPPENHGFESFL